MLCHNGVQSTLVAQIVFSLRRICNLCVKVVAYQLQGPSNTIGEFNSVFVCNGYIINSDEQAVQSQRLWLGWQLITISLSVINVENCFTHVISHGMLLLSIMMT